MKLRAEWGLICLKDKIQRWQEALKVQPSTSGCGFITIWFGLECQVFSSKHTSWYLRLNQAWLGCHGLREKTPTAQFTLHHFQSREIIVSSTPRNNIRLLIVLRREFWSRCVVHTTWLGGNGEKRGGGSHTTRLLESPHEPVWLPNHIWRGAWYIKEARMPWVFSKFLGSKAACRIFSYSCWITAAKTKRAVSTSRDYL